MLESLKVQVVTIWFCRRHPDTPTLMSFNLFLGWTIAGWLVSLAWALRPIPQRVPMLAPTR